MRGLLSWRQNINYASVAFFKTVTRGILSDWTQRAVESISIGIFTFRAT
jgi:hypothetical protein